MASKKEDKLFNILDKAEQAERIRILSDKIKEWHPDAAIEFMEFFQANYPKSYVTVFMAYEEWIRGN